MIPKMMGALGLWTGLANLLLLVCAIGSVDPLVDISDRMDVIVEAGGLMNQRLRLLLEAGALLREACNSQRAA